MVMKYRGLAALSIIVLGSISRMETRKLISTKFDVPALLMGLRCFSETHEIINFEIDAASRREFHKFSIQSLTKTNITL